MPRRNSVKRTRGPQGTIGSPLIRLNLWPLKTSTHSSPPSSSRFFGKRVASRLTVPRRFLIILFLVHKSWTDWRDGRRGGRERERERTASLAYYSKVSSDFPRRRPANLWTLLLGEVIAIKHRKLAKLRCNLAGDVLPLHLHFSSRDACTCTCTQQPTAGGWYTQPTVRVERVRVRESTCSSPFCRRRNVPPVPSSLRGGFTRASVGLFGQVWARARLCLRVYTDDVVKSWEISRQRLDPRFGN